MEAFLSYKVTWRQSRLSLRANFRLPLRKYNGAQQLQ